MFMGGNTPVHTWATPGIQQAAQDFAKLPASQRHTFVRCVTREAALAWLHVKEERDSMLAIWQAVNRQRMLQGRNDFSSAFFLPNEGRKVVRLSLLCGRHCAPCHYTS